MTNLINPNHVFDGLFSFSQEKKIVYHGSGEIGLEEIDGFTPDYEGGIGSGTYVAFDRDVAKYYSHGGSVYVLELLISDDKILYLSPYDGNLEPIYLSDGGELNSMLIGENVKPFSFSFGDKQFWVIDEYSADAVFASMKKERLLEELPEKFHFLIDEETGSIDIDDAYEKIEEKVYEKSPENLKKEFDDFSESKPDFWEKIYKDFPNLDIIERQKQHSKMYDEWNENRNKTTIENKTEKIVSRIFKIVDKIENEIEFQRGNTTMIEMEDIGNIAEQHGYDAVYVEGIRGGHPDSELLVFDPSKLRLIREETPDGEILRKF